MRIILNPLEGAVIKDIMYKDNLLFSAEEEDQWDVGTIRQFEEEDHDICDFLLGLFGFLEVISSERAAKIIEESKHAYPCKEPGCDFVTNIPAKLALHVKNHKRDKELSALGIPKFKSNRKNVLELTEDQREREYEKQLQKEALTVGEGLVVENPKTVIMS